MEKERGGGEADVGMLLSEMHSGLGLLIRQHAMLGGITVGIQRREKNRTVYRLDVECIPSFLFFLHFLHGF